MLEQHLLPRWPEIFRRIGEPEPRRNRARCPIHGGESLYSLSVDEGKGVFHCFVCHAGGDKLDFIQQALRLDFKDALRWCGLEPGQPPKLNPLRARAQMIRENLRAWKRRIGRQSRDLLAARHELEVCAVERLEADRDDEAGWQLLAATFKGYDRDEHIADAVDLADEHDDAELLRVYSQFRGCYGP
ncbi:MAG: dnaG [Deltaproteobacteria bacterium]|nr:dnaG [Deltaproteobacteria bacterium]